MKCPRAALFDLDETLAPSFQPISADMGARVTALLNLIPVAIVTGAGMNRLESMFLPIIGSESRLEQLYLFPNSAAECYRFKNAEWSREYFFTLTPEERTVIQRAIEESVEETGIIAGATVRGPQLIDRETQVAYAFLGIDVTEDDKKNWDPTHEKRMAMRDALTEKLPQFEILIGGKTSIDVTKKGVNKSYGVTWFSKELGIPPQDMLYVGDALYPGGNDEVVIQTGVQARQVESVAETADILDELCVLCAK